MDTLVDPLFDTGDFHDGWDFVDLIGLLGRSFFQEQHSTGPIFGSPGEDAHGWIEQTTPFTCAVVAQEMILHAFGINASEAQLTYEAAANGWLTEGGTSMENLARLLDLHGVPSHISDHGGAAVSLSFELNASGGCLPSLTLVVGHEVQDLIWYTGTAVGEVGAPPKDWHATLRPDTRTPVRGYVRCGCVRHFATGLRRWLLGSTTGFRQT